MRSWIFAGLGVLLILGMTAAQEPIPTGDEFQVNTFTTSDQFGSSVEAVPTGEFIVVWTSQDQDGSGLGVFGQRFSDSGTAIGSEFQINTTATSDQNASWGARAIASSSSGSFVVVWQSLGSSGTDTDSWSVQAQRFAADGTSLGSEFQVNTYTTGMQIRPTVGMEASGDFVVTWDSYGQEYTIQAQRYTSQGTPVDGEFQVNTNTAYYNTSSEVAFFPSGEFVVLWSGENHVGANYGILMQRYAADGTPQGSETQVNSYTGDDCAQPTVAVDDAGDFVAAWLCWGSDGSDSDGSSIHARRFLENGTPIGSQFQVNSYTTGYQAPARVGTDAHGEFIVVWRSWGSYGTDQDETSVQAQAFSTDGSAKGGQFQINTYSTDQQRSPSVAVEDDGDFVVVWDSQGSFGTDTSGKSIQGQRYALLIFTDGFESGDTSAWSNAVP